jgi:hypothetical protein
VTQIFLSYAREDEAQVRDVYYRLLDAGFDVWMDKINLLPGQRWQQEIPQAIRHSDFILIFFSKRSVARRGYIQREFRLALDTGFPEQAYRKRRSVRQWVKLWSKTRVTFHVYRGQKPLGYCWRTPKCRKCASPMPSLKAQEHGESKVATAALSHRNRFANSIPWFSPRLALNLACESGFLPRSL